ncbi:MAG: GIY-YIG nuclease family protein [Bacteroidales bacterium]|nr:GIY-YIG nuclease family protein [Bacteroidales bacterium]
MKEYILEELLPSNAIEIAKDYNIVFSRKKSGVYYQKGDVIGKILITEYNQYELVTNLYIDEFQLFAPDSGVYDFTILKKIRYDYMPCKRFMQDRIVVCKSYLDFQEMAEDIINKYCNYEIVDDVFNREKKILWKFFIYLDYYHDDFELRFKGPNSKCFPFVRLDNSKEQFVFQYEKKDFSVHKFAKGDTFHFLFENNKHLEYQLRKAAANTNNSNYKQVTFTMLPQDIKLFASENLIGIRCEFQNGDAPLELKKENDLASLTFKFYFQKYIKALLECGVNIDVADKCESTSEVKKELLKSKEESCFVYLMKDETNGYHKIGISNRPEYRERTLQSEKPTIVLLCAKEFPTRIIAEAIESALHKAFEDKRLRGEWFNLSDKDVMEITMTLC